MIGRTNCTQKGGSPSEFVNIQLLTNQAEHSNLNGAVLTMSYETYSKQYTWDGKEITFSIPAHVSCAIEFPEVEGYKKPDNITFVAVEGNSRTIEAEYKAELVKVNVTSSNGSAVNGATLTINGKQHPWNGTEIRQLVPFGTQYSVVASDIDGFGTPSTQTFTAQNPEREVSVVYIASSLKVNILSNQGTDAAIANVKATVTYGDTSVEVANGGTVNLPTNVSVTISFPEVADYKKPVDITYTHTGGLVEKSGTYQCELLTVNVSADSGSVSGFEVTISKQEVVGVSTKYTRLEYIESTGSAWMDTGFKPTNKTKVEMKVAANSKSFYVAINQGSTGRFGIYAATSGQIDFAFGASGYISSAATGASYPADITLENGRLTCNGNVYTFASQSAFALTYNLPIFGSTASNGTTSGVGGRLYSFKIYENGTLVRDYIPALRSDGIAGLYDVVNDTFTASSGTSNATAGSKYEEVIARQTSVTGSYKIPFDASYIVQSSSISGYTTPASVTRIASSKTHVVEQQYKVVTIRDLSLYDVYGNAINRSTANCYVIKETGQYKFPCVYGNAIKNGKVNAAAYTNNGGSYSHNFVAGDMGGGNPVITTPYMPMEYYTLDVRTSDANDVISDLSIEEGSECMYVKFKITSIPTSGANIVICARGNVCWSWHLWIWPHDLSPVEITNSTGVRYKIMPTNLASKYDSDGVHIKNWFYQWGRPMPLLCPSAWNSTTDHTPGVITKTSKAGNISEALDLPEMFYYNSASPYNWFGDKSYYNLWDAACTGTGNSDNDTVKTVYDPCPVGWKIPNGNTFTGLSIISSANGIVKMARYSGDTIGVGFPLSGSRSYHDGSLKFVGSYGFVWLSSAFSQNGAYRMYFNSDDVVPYINDNRAYGFSVRPVADDITKIDTI